MIAATRYELDDDERRYRGAERAEIQAVEPPPDPHADAPDVPPEGAATTTDGLAQCSDLGNAHRLRELHGADLRFARSVGWLVYDGRHYEQDATGAAQRRAHDVALTIMRDALKLRARALADEADRVARAFDAPAQAARQIGTAADAEPEPPDAAPGLSSKGETP